MVGIPPLGHTGLMIVSCGLLTTHYPFLGLEATAGHSQGIISCYGYERKVQRKFKKGK